MTRVVVSRDLTKSDVLLIGDRQYHPVAISRTINSVIVTIPGAELGMPHDIDWTLGPDWAITVVDQTAPEEHVSTGDHLDFDVDDSCDGGADPWTHAVPVASAPPKVMGVDYVEAAMHLLGRAQEVAGPIDQLDRVDAVRLAQVYAQLAVAEAITRQTDCFAELLDHIGSRVDLVAEVLDSAQERAPRRRWWRSR